MAAIQKSVDSSSLADIIDRILDKGLVIDIYARISLVGIELISIDARIVIAGIDKWLYYAEKVGLLDKHPHLDQGEEIILGETL
ncbi:gas vesicle protein GvpJ [Bacillus sp. UNC41MFS5]|uniref:gas vesicle protein GvpJ n=1 Tax=Bacillus sp. UNC41MFS5 TaxID=1449046 RepID=UPI000478C08F|nr:gas vesicle protein GvpJ [Bacillus sp. UNC41MFS5]